ncbi:MAG: hypothetical protein ACO3QV_07895, partial [Candidatus Nanopelagicaceae bacterium]
MKTRLFPRSTIYDLQSFASAFLSDLCALAVNLYSSLREDDIRVGAVAEEFREEGEEQGVDFLDELGEEAEAIGEGLHGIAKEVEHLDLAFGESAFLHVLELGEVEVALVAEFVLGHAP